MWVTSSFLTHLGKISRRSWSEKKASFIQVEKKKEARTPAPGDRGRGFSLVLAVAAHCPLAGLTQSKSSRLRGHSQSVPRILLLLVF